MTDIIDLEAGVAAGSGIDAARRARPNAREHSQAAFEALFTEPGIAPAALSAFSLTERFAVAAFVTSLTGSAIETYPRELAALDTGLAGAVADAALSARARGPFGHYPPSGVSAEDTDGLRWTADAVSGISPRVAAALTHAHLLTLRPREAAPAALATLQDAGWSVDGIVSLSQLVSFLTYQLRVIHGLRVVAGHAGATPGDGFAMIDPRPDAAAQPTRDDGVPPAFTQEQLWWEPWLPPIEKDALTAAHYDGLVERARAALPYFRLLARDPKVLRARTLADLDIFTNEDGGLPRAERELAAAAVSRLNGCLFCASVHARSASRFSGRRDDVQRLLDDGVDARIDERWDAIIDAAADLSRTPIAFDAAHVHRLRAAGLEDQALVDLIGSAAFFNWANRLMLSIGEPRVDPARLETIREYENRPR
ncbi:alkylhydroperoxidase domain protein [Microbacterium sp. No. 7]|uniref:alkylhydroperoxidase domain protein n=1 Tax=Microbacterium sp. No. 7 TaxID=1714373 RepID=UPI0006D0399B|nr:alkylhydroperoxidase domain protein [Microbacterium sp. No. 7]ALJ22108.1 hypothetical protein AOA12_20365 [Microbacterium sp. No. 7]